MASERKRGFYWVQYFLNAWQIAEWTGRHWIKLGAFGHVSDSHWASIGERIPDHE